MDIQQKNEHSPTHEGNKKHHSSSFGMLKSELQEQIEGYSFPVLSPFGKVLSLNVDLYSTQRSITEVENNLGSFFRPFTTYSTQRSSFSQDVKALAKSSVLESLGLQKNTHECIFMSEECEMNSFKKLSQLFVNQIKGEKQGVKVNVYIAGSSHYSGVLPWLSHPERVRIITLETDANGVVKPSSLVSAVLKNSQKSKIQIIQLSGLSTVTRQSIDLKALYEQIDALRIEFPQCLFYGIVEGGNLLTSYSIQDRKNALNSFDISLFTAQHLLGGLQASSIALFRKDVFQQLSAKGGQFLVRESQQISAIQALRSCQLLQFHNREHIEDRIQYESSINSQLFYEEIKQANQRLQEISLLNKIDLINISSFAPNGRYSIRILTESSTVFLEQEARGYPVLLARHASQLLHDLFGIIAKPNTVLKSSNNFRFTQTPNHIIEEYGLHPESGFTEMNNSPLDIDIHFLLSPADIIYLVAALEQLAMHGTKLFKFYNKTTLKPKAFKLTHADISLDVCSKFHQHPLMEEEERSIQYSKQLAESTKILKSPQNYFSMNENWVEDRSIVFPLDALFSPFPTKNREPQKERVDGGDDNDDDESDSFLSDRSIKKRDIVNSKEIQEARNLILRIRNNIPEKKEENMVVSEQILPERMKSNSHQLGQPSLSIDEDYIDSSKMNDEMIDKLKLQIRCDVEQEYKNKIIKQEQLSLNEQMKLRENRAKNLRIIFNFYGHLQDILDDPTDQQSTDSKSIKKNGHNTPHHSSNKSQIISISQKQQLLKQNEANLQMGANKFFKFCHDFDIIGGQLDIKTLYILFNKVAEQSSTNIYNRITRQQQIKFNQFQTIIEKMAAVYFSQNYNLYTQIDKYEQFARLLGLDDIKLFKPKLKTEGLVQFSFIFHDKYQLFSAGPLKDKQYSDALKNMDEIQQKLMNPSRMKEQQSLPELHLEITKSKEIIGSKRELSKFINHQENKQDWNIDNSTMNPKHLYSDQRMTENDVFSEIALLSSIKSKKTNHSKSYINHNNEYQEDIPYSIKNTSQSSLQHPLHSPSKSSLANVKLKGMINDPSDASLQQKRNANYQYSISSQNISKPPPLLSLLGQIPSSPKTPIIDQSSQLKLQVLNRAKQIATIEKERDSQRLNSIGSISGEMNSWSHQTETDQVSFYIKSPMSKPYQKPEFGISNRPNLSLQKIAS